MQTLFAPLFKPFAIINYPIRYFLILFLTILAGFHLAFDMYGWLMNHEFMSAEKIISISIIFSTVVYISQYFKQKNLKQLAS